MTPGIVAESDLAGTTTSEYVFFAGERVARRDGVSGAGGVFYYFSDHLKTASVITDASGTIKAESDYYPWGGELQFTNNDSNHYKFTGKERDTETGLDYFGARYYSNGLARWVSADWSPTPIPVPYADFGDPQTLNLYGYVGGNPASRTDFDGHDDALHFFGRELKGFGKAVVNAVPETYNSVAKFINIQIQADPTMSRVPLMQEMPTVHVNNDDPAEVIGNGVGKLAIIVATGAEGGEKGPVKDHVNDPAPEPYNRSEHYGNPSSSPVAKEIRAAGEGKPCSKCGETMNSGTKTAPTAEHKPTLKAHYYNKGHKMTPAERRA